ncbi:MAG: PAS domain-containing protein [Caldilineaceae bacterium]|nr:PAS domain-containing protein [Caldilineaceae bacterium]
MDALSERIRELEDELARLRAVQTASQLDEVESMMITAAKAAPGAGTEPAIHLASVPEPVRAQNDGDEPERDTRLPLDAASIGTWVLYEGSAYAHINEVMQRLFGFAPGSSIVPTEQFFAVIHPDDRSSVARDMEQAWNVTKELATEFRVHIDGKIHWFTALGRMIELDDRRQMMGVTYEITRFKKIEARVRRRNTNLESSVEERTQQIRDLVVRLDRAEEKERRRISRFLHDDVQPLLYAVQIQLHHAQTAYEAGESVNLLESLAEATKWTGTAIRLARRLVNELNPLVLDGTCYTDHVLWVCGEQEELHGLTVDLRLQDDIQIAYRPLRRLLFQTLREPLFNVAKHADTDRAAVDVFEDEDHLVLCVTDQGRGIDGDPFVHQAGEQLTYGLATLRERLAFFGADVTVDSARGRGTKETVRVPCAELGAGASQT